MVLFKYFIKSFTSRPHYIGSGIHSLDHVTDTVVNLCHAPNTDLQKGGQVKLNNKGFMVLGIHATMRHKVSLKA